MRSFALPPPTPPSKLACAPALLQALLQCNREEFDDLAATLGSFGDAPANPDEEIIQHGMELGMGLAEHGLHGHVRDLARLGWAPILHPASDSRQTGLLWLLASGEQGLPSFKALAAGGLAVFGDARAAPGPLLIDAIDAIDRADKPALEALLAQLRHEQAGSPREAAELSKLARHAFPRRRSRARLAPFIHSDPGPWARAFEDWHGNPAKHALEAGDIPLARTIIQADPAAALAKMNPLRVDEFLHPLASIDLLAEMGADLRGPAPDGVGALCWAALCKKHSKAAVKKLLALGCDPRERCSGGSSASDSFEVSDDEDNALGWRSGATAIGVAATMGWSWAELQDVFGALPKDLMDSIHRPSHGRDTLPAALAAIYHSQLYASTESEHARHDKIFSELIRESSKDPRGRHPQFVEHGARLAAQSGLPSAMRELLGLAANIGTVPQAKLFVPCLLASGYNEAISKGRLSCLRAAAAAGVDLAAPCSQETDRHGMPATLLADAMQEMVDATSSHLGQGPESALSRGSHARSAMALLVEFGSDPSPCRDKLSSRWAFDPKGPGGRDGLHAAAREAFEAIDALMEAKELRASLPTSASEPRRATRI